MIAAVVLAAGESSRMGRPKALLPIDGVRFIEKIVSSFQSTKVGKILVVLGHNAEEMRQKIADLPVLIVVNNEYKKGQLSSLVAAIRDIQSRQSSAELDGILVHLVDHPYVNPILVDVMIDRFYESKKLIVVPRYHGRRGHPVIFSRSLFSELLNAALDQGAKTVVHAHQKDTLEIDTEDEGVTIDIDTPEEYRQFVKES
ncbi:MAG: nucleotidyltransferase family protein [Deltaproteobacteria bacterium]|jgi:molybdenum cofactor cytidylyltransferase|nr:MAG: nucleotidyltransferase family protein [Deltaproteobacteria bacterium]